MAKWNPLTDPVGKNEPVGRRLFDEPMLKGAADQRTFSGLNLRNFEETRDKQLSLDRMGQTGITRSVKSYLIPRAESAAKKFTPAKQFNGWVVVSAKFLESGYEGKKFPVVASPQDGIDLDRNDYHAHSEIPSDLNSTIAALFVREIFGKRGKLERCEEKPVLFQVAIETLKKWLNGILNRA
jgi:hypothetical protein